MAAEARLRDLASDVSILLGSQLDEEVPDQVVLRREHSAVELAEDLEARVLEVEEHLVCVEEEPLTRLGREVHVDLAGEVHG